MENENNYKKRYKNAKNRSDIDLSDIDFESSVAYDFDKQRRREKRKNSKYTKPCLIIYIVYNPQPFP